MFQISESLALVQTVDFFTPIVDDAHAWGRIAAANALSDIYAMGARPQTALNLVGWPRKLGLDLLGRVLEGGRDACGDAGVAIVGGHSVDDPEPKYGLAVTGLADPARLVRKRGSVPGHELVLTKPLGTGIICSAIKDAAAPPETVRVVTESMSALNAVASEVMLDAGARAATDVTGFGLIGHLLEMLDEGVSVSLSLESIPVLPGAAELAAQGVWPGGSRRNLEATRARVRLGAGVTEVETMVLFDAQTSGGLLIAIDEGKAGALVSALHARGVTDTRAIGFFREGDRTIEVAP